MKQTVITIIFRWIAPLLVLAGGLWFVYAMGAREKPNRRKAPPRKSVPVQIVKATPHSGPVDIVASGVAAPWRELRLSAQVGGEVIFKADCLNPGRVVKKDEVLLTIDPQDYQLEVTRLEQELAKADQELSNLKVRTENTQRLLTLNQQMVKLRQQDVDRVTRLRAANATSFSELDAAKLELLTISQQLTTHQNQLREFAGQTQSLKLSRDLVALQRRQAQLDLSRTEVKAPFTGVVIGTSVEQNAILAPGTPIAALEDTSMIEVRCSLPVDDVDFILQNHAVDQRTDASAGQLADSSVQNTAAELYELPEIPVTVEYARGDHVYRWDGTLSRQDGLGIDEKTRTMPVRVRVSDPQSRGNSSLAEPRPMALIRGMFVKVRLHCQSQTPLLAIPESVLRPGKTLWLMEDGKLKIEQLNIIRIEDGFAFLNATKSGLSADSSVISSPVPNARNGLAVSLPAPQTPRRKNGGHKNGPAKAADKRPAKKGAA